MITVGEWCKALEIGEYQQGRGTLLNAGRYCCLGVGYEKAGFVCGHLDMPKHPFLSDLPPIMADAPSNGVRVLFRGAWETVDALNDDKAFTFRQIAALVRETVRKVNAGEVSE